MRRFRLWYVLPLLTFTVAAFVGAGVGHAGPALHPLAQAEVLDQQITSGTASLGVGSTMVYIGQTFTAGVSGALTRVQFQVSSSPISSDHTIEIRSVDGAGLPTATMLSTGTLAGGAAAGDNR